MSKADKIKSIVKRPAEGSKFGTDPSDPWSTKANIAEWAGNPAGLLGKYLKSRGINPKFATKDQKIAHSKTGQFAKWQKDHSERSSPTGTTLRGESTDACAVCGQTPCNCTSIEEAVDKKDTITFDIPLLIRVLELAREDIKSDMDLHRVVERLIDIRNKGVLTMDDYDTIAAIKEEVYGSVKLDYIKQALSEAKEADYGGDYQDSVLALKKKAEKKKVDMKSLADRMQAAYRRENQSKGVKPVAEEQGYWVHREKDTKQYHNSVSGIRKAKHPAHLKVTDSKHKNLGTVADVLRNQTLYKTEETLSEMDSQKPTGRMKSDGTRSHSTYGSRDNDVSSGPDVHLGPESIVNPKKLVSGALKTLNKAMSKGEPRRTMGLHASLEKHADDKMKELGHLFKPKSVKEDISRRGLLKGIVGAGAAGAAGKASAIAGAFPTPSHQAAMYKAAAESNAAESKRQAEKKKKDDADRLEKNTAEVEKQQKINHHSLANEEVSKKSVLGRVLRGHELKKKVDSSFEKIGDAQKKGDSAGASKAFRDHERYANLERPGTWTKVKEDTFQDPKSASQMPFDGANNPNDIAPPEYKGKRLIQMSKSARIIKSIYKNKGMKNEETYDFEKADKSVTSYGKPPKVSKTDKAITDSDKEKAAIVLSGGKTLTGDERDTIEIDPKMKMRPNQQPEPVKSGNPQVK